MTADGPCRTLGTRLHVRVRRYAAVGGGRGARRPNEGLAGGATSPTARPRRGLVVAADAAAPRRAPPPRAPVPRTRRARHRHARRVHARRAAAAVPREARRRRRDRRGRPAHAQRGRRRVPRRRHRSVRALGRADLLHGLGRRARARRPPHPALPATSSASRSASTSATAPARSSAASRTTSRRSTSSSRTASRASSRTASSSSGTAVVLFLLDWRLALATLRRPAADGRSRPRGSGRARTARIGACGSGSGW